MHRYGSYVRELRPLLRLMMAADPVAPLVARHQVRRWLVTSAWPADQLPDIVLALSEAVTNAAEHAYRDRPHGMIELRGGIELAPNGRRGVTLTVRDHGRWRPPPVDDGDRGRGIALIGPAWTPSPSPSPRTERAPRSASAAKPSRRPAEVTNEGS